jgi:N,N'-diacetyllegionaminate synthase
MPSSKTFLIAEAGVNHNGSFDTALRLIDASKGAGADAVKFQLFDSMRLWGDDRIERFQLSDLQMDDLYSYCKQVGSEFMCTPFDFEAVEFLKTRVKRMKVASGFIRRLQFLDAVNATGLPVILSTGMSSLGDIDLAMKCFSGEVILLQCTSSYPCRVEDVNLRAMLELEEYGRKVGLSDHTSSITIPIAAVAMGATVIEKHLTLDRNQHGPDHQTSITPREFKAMRLAIMDVEYAMGDGKKRVLECERKLREVWT